MNIYVVLVEEVSDARQLVDVEGLDGDPGVVPEQLVFRCELELVAAEVMDFLPQHGSVQFQWLH